MGGMMGYRQPGSYGTAQGYYGPQQSYYSPQQPVTGSAVLGNTNSALANGATGSPNDPATVLTYATQLNLNAKQVQRLTKMRNSGQQQATRVLNAAGKRKLAVIVGAVAAAGGP